jgi:hypothetical protein
MLRLYTHEVLFMHVILQLADSELKIDVDHLSYPVIYSLEYSIDTVLYHTTLQLHKMRTIISLGLKFRQPPKINKRPQNKNNQLIVKASISKTGLDYLAA